MLKYILEYLLKSYIGRLTNFSLNLPSTGVHTSFSGVRVSQSLVFCVVFCRSLFVPLSDYWPLYYMSLYNLRPLITAVVSSNFWPLSCLSLYDLWPLITPVVSSNFGHCLVCPCSMYGLRLPLWYLKTFGHCLVYPCSIYGL